MAWYTAASGVTCVAAYDAVGAASLADSYTNEANPGTYTAAPGTAPTWAYGTGWTFNGTTQYLTTGGLVASTGWSAIARYSGWTTSNDRYLFGSYDTGTVTLFAISPRTGGASVSYWNGRNPLGVRTINPLLAAGVLGFAGTTCYRNAVSDGSLTNAFAPTAAVYIGALNASGAASNFAGGSIQALAIYSGVLTLADVQAITTAMNALPTAAAKGMPVIEHWHNTMFLR